jgi:hypothetical protein
MADHRAMLAAWLRCQGLQVHEVRRIVGPEVDPDGVPREAREAFETSTERRCGSCGRAEGPDVLLVRVGLVSLLTLPPKRYQPDNLQHVCRDCNAFIRQDQEREVRLEALCRDNEPLVHPTLGYAWYCRVCEYREQRAFGTQGEARASARAHMARKHANLSH